MMPNSPVNNFNIDVCIITNTMCITLSTVSYQERESVPASRSPYQLTTACPCSV